MNVPDAIWGPPDVSSWQELPHVAGRLATESDVKLGHAVLFIARENGLPPVARPNPMALPRCAVLRPESPESHPLAVIVIQAEEVDTKVLVGYRPLAGGNGICTWPRSSFFKNPTSGSVPKQLPLASNTYEDSPRQETKISSALKKRTLRKSANKKHR
jgi:hypothetical protein